MLDVPERFQIILTADLDEAQRQRLRRWTTLVDSLVQMAHAEPDPIVKKHFLPCAEEIRVLFLLLEPSHVHGGLLRDGAPGICSRQVCRAIDFMNAHSASPLTLADLAQSAGCSIRTLSRAFQKFFGMTPMRSLRDIRLQQVREQLLSPHNADGSYGVGISIRPSDAIVVALDYLKYKNASASGIRNVVNIALALGTAGGTGFRFRDQDVFRLGAAFALNKQMMLHAGVSQSSKPITSNNTLLTFAAPLTMRTNYTAGLSYEVRNGFELSANYAYGVFEKVTRIGVSTGMNPYSHINWFAFAIGKQF